MGMGMMGNRAPVHEVCPRVSGTLEQLILETDKVDDCI